MRNLKAEAMFRMFLKLEGWPCRPEGFRKQEFSGSRPNGENR
jgi:hypothetical protein